ncbi:MAG: STAS domain-containing protein [Lachnospiraceae bacterium]|nr:STAS domain-containing protein [Lachnospiraceae bacterium]
MLILDLKDLKYLSSAGLREILDLQKIMDDHGEMIVKNPSPMIIDVFKVSGFNRIMNIEVDQGDSSM